MLGLRARTGLTTLLLVGTGSVAQAKPPAVIIFGGGWGPDGTQVSIEAHVQALVDVLKPAEPEVLFAGPDPNARSVQVLAGRDDEVGSLLALVFGEAGGVGVDYRTTSVSMSGPANEASLLEAISKRTSRPEGLIVFGVGHGQLLGEGSNQESALSLWGSREALSLTRLTQALDRTPRKGPLAMVLGQCHSGGFTKLAFVGAEPRRSLAQPVRCVLAAVPADRPASGCTSDLSDASARAFIALVAEAFARPGEADLDRDRTVSLSEAFTYARVHDHTVNVPVRSSEIYLRQVVPELPEFPSRRVLLARASPEEKVVLEALVPQGEVAEVKKQFRLLQEERERANVRLDELIRASDEARTTLHEILFDRWPELTSRLHVVSRRLLSEDAPELRAFLDGRPELKALEAARNAEAEEEARLESLERQSARLERWIRAAENVVYERALKGRPGHRRHLAALRACEAATPLGR